MVAALLAAFLASSMAAKEQTLDELKARLSSTSVGGRPQICLQIAERQLDDADKLYSAFDSEKAEVALADVVTFSELARDYSIQSHKHQKQTEIAVRKMTRKLNDLKHVVSRDQEAVVQNAIDRLQRVRDDLLLAMFPKGEKREEQER
ncbi:MAG: hypothetical protein WA389_16975 [Terriglobales bacterium]